MHNTLKNIAIALVATCLLPSAAWAHARLDHATPSVGSTISASPEDLQLTFSEGVEAALSGVSITTASGEKVPASKATGEGANGTTLHVKLGRALSAGVYVVHWHVVSVDTHATSGTYKFTIAP